MHIWHIKIMMRGEALPREQPMFFKQTMPVRDSVIEDLIVDGKVVRAKIKNYQKTRAGLSGYDVNAEEIE